MSFMSSILFLGSFLSDPFQQRHGAHKFPRATTEFWECPIDVSHASLADVSGSSGDLENRIYELQLQLREGRLGDSVQHAEVPVVMRRCMRTPLDASSLMFVRRNVKLRRA